MNLNSAHFYQIEAWKALMDMLAHCFDLTDSSKFSEAQQRFERNRALAQQALGLSTGNTDSFTPEPTASKPQP